MNSNVYLDGESTIKGNINDATVVGSNSLIEQGATLSLCVLGKNTQIGKNAKLKKCIILSDCDIGQDVILDNVVIGNNVKIANKSVIKNCYIGDDVHLPEEEYFDQRIKIDRNDEDNLNSIEYIQNEAFIRDLDDKGLMFLEYQAEDDDEDDDESSAQEEEEEEEEDFDDEVKLIVNGGGKQEDIVLELISLQKAMFERTIYDSNILLI
jgi:carbonic anhydrase/acetyltransferase-like protein (isoleucine patch superfamily)